MKKMVTGERVSVRELTYEYVPDYLDMFTSEVQKILGVSSVWSEFEYVHNQLAKTGERKSNLYVIFENETDILIGSIEIRPPEYRGQLYTWIHQDYWGKGLFQEAFTLVCSDYFATYPSIVQFTARVDVSNGQSLRALMRAGCECMHTTRGPREDQYEVVCYRKS